MKRIHILNYEAYALDYLEGTLPPEELQAFESFLERHPEVASELEGWEETYLAPPTIAYPHRQKLVRREGTVWIGKWSIAASWAVLIVLTGLWWLLPAPAADSPAVAHVFSDEKASIVIAQVVPSESKLTDSKALSARAAYQPNNEPRQKPAANAGVSPSLQAVAAVREVKTIDRLPSSHIRHLEPAVTVIQTRKAGVGGSYASPDKKGALLNSEKIAVLDPLSQLLSEDQKAWVAQWRPIENIKEELNRDRWADALTPEFLQSPKSAK